MTNGHAPARILDDELFFSDPADTHVIRLADPYISQDGTLVAAYNPHSRHSVTIRRIFSETAKREWAREMQSGEKMEATIPNPVTGEPVTVSINVTGSYIELLIRVVTAWTFVRADGSPVPITREWLTEMGPAGAWLEQAIIAFYLRKAPAEAENRDFTTAAAA